MNYFLTVIFTYYLFIYLFLVGTFNKFVYYQIYVTFQSLESYLTSDAVILSNFVSGFRPISDEEIF